MPFHIELASSGHNFPHHGAIVVNSITGEHKSNHPIPLPRAKAQLRVLNSIYHHEKKSMKK
jgi:hypothetical protein